MAKATKSKPNKTAASSKRARAARPRAAGKPLRARTAKPRPAAKSSAPRATKPDRPTATAKPAAKRAGGAPVISPALQPVVDALSRMPGVTVEKGWGSSSVALKVRGKIFAMSMGADLVLKLPKVLVDRHVESGDGTRFDPRKDGRVMNEWLVVPPGGPPWVDRAREAYRFVRTTTAAG